jgi:hypothetical protein
MQTKINCFSFVFLPADGIGLPFLLETETSEHRKLSASTLQRLSKISPGW